MNTYVGAFWIVVAVYYVLRWNEHQTWPVLLAIGSAIGLAIMTKGTAYVFLPCALLACWFTAPMGVTTCSERFFTALANVTDAE